MQGSEDSGFEFSGRVVIVCGCKAGETCRSNYYVFTWITTTKKVGLTLQVVCPVLCRYNFLIGSVSGE